MQSLCQEDTGHVRGTGCSQRCREVVEVLGEPHSAESCCPWRRLDFPLRECAKPQTGFQRRKTGSYLRFEKTPLNTIGKRQVKVEGMSRD